MRRDAGCAALSRWAELAMCYVLVPPALTGVMMSDHAVSAWAWPCMRCFGGYLSPVCLRDTHTSAYVRLNPCVLYNRFLSYYIGQGKLIDISGS